MHILLAPDSFKVSLSAKQVAEALKRISPRGSTQMQHHLPSHRDGGRRHHGNPSWSSGCNGVSNSQVAGPFGQPVSMSYYQKDEMAF